MFERFTEEACRSIFFARYEASRLRSSYIETEHLLLGILQEHKQIFGKLHSGARQAIRTRIDKFSTPGPDEIPTSADLPVSHQAKQALGFAAEESETLHHEIITPDHLVLGLLRVEGSFAAALLRDYGLDYELYRVEISEAGPPGRRRGFATARGRLELALERPSAWHSGEGSGALDPALQGSVRALQSLVDSTVENVHAHSDVYAQQRLKRRPWTRKQAFGHLIDWACTHQRWFARALTEPTLMAGPHPFDEWVSVERYDDFSWQDALDLWVSLNRLLIHVMQGIPEAKLSMPCRVGIAEPIPLSDLVARYVEHCEDVVGQILARL